MKLTVSVCLRTLTSVFPLPVFNGIPDSEEGELHIKEPQLSVGVDMLLYAPGDQKAVADDGIPLKEKSYKSSHLSPTLYRNNSILHKTFVCTRQNGIRELLNQSVDWFECVIREGPAV